MSSDELCVAWDRRHLCLWLSEAGLGFGGDPAGSGSGTGTGTGTDGYGHEVLAEPRRISTLVASELRSHSSRDGLGS